MKKFVLLSAVSVALAMAASEAVASSNGPFTLTMSGTVETVKTNTGAVQTTQTKSFNNATIYLMISNAVATAPNGIATNLPANGIFVYNPNANDGTVQGVFYVTTKGSTNFYQLSGSDTIGNYYSYMELDTTNAANSGGPLGFDFGPTLSGADDFNTVASFTASGSGKSSSTAIFYVHDNPYAFDAADAFVWLDGIGEGLNSPNPTANNIQFSLEMQGILTITTTQNSGSATFSGTSGNALIGGKQALILSGKVTIK